MAARRPSIHRQLGAWDLSVHRKRGSRWHRVPKLGESMREDLHLYLHYLIKFAMHSMPFVVAGVGAGLASMWYYSHHSPRRLPDGTHGWPEVAAAPLFVTILGSALSFLLVFRLSWAFARWSSARSLLGSASSRLKRLSVLLHAQLGDNATENDEERCLLDELNEVCDLFFGAVALSLERGPAHEYGVERRSHPGVIGATAHDQVLATHQWLARVVRRGAQLGLVPDAAAISAYEDHGALLREYFEALAIKTTPLPVPLQCLISILKVTYTVAIFPQTMSYTYMMKLDDAQAEKRIIWANKLYVATFVAITTLGIMFFSVLHLIALELDDPFGHDLSDIDLHAQIGRAHV